MPKIGAKTDVDDASFKVLNLFPIGCKKTTFLPYQFCVITLRYGVAQVSLTLPHHHFTKGEKFMHCFTDFIGYRTEIYSLHNQYWRS